MATGERPAKRTSAKYTETPTRRTPSSATPREQEEPGVRELARTNVGEVVDTYLSRLYDQGKSIDDVGGVDAVVGAVEAALPRVNRLAERAGTVYTTAQLQQLLPGVHAPAIRDQAIYNRTQSRRLIAAKTSDGRIVYPAFQFVVRPGRLQVRNDVIELWKLLPASEQRIDAWTLIAWLNGPRKDLEGQTPLEWLDGHGLDERLQRAAGQVRRRAAA